MEETIMAKVVIQLLIVGFLLAGCSGSIQIPPQPQPVVVQNDTPPAVCLVRARLFKGLVGVPCSNLAQEFRP